MQIKLLIVGAIILLLSGNHCLAADEYSKYEVAGKRCGKQRCHKIIQLVKAVQ